MTLHRTSESRTATIVAEDSPRRPLWSWADRVRARRGPCFSADAGPFLAIAALAALASRLGGGGPVAFAVVLGTQGAGYALRTRAVWSRGETAAVLARVEAVTLAALAGIVASVALPSGLVPAPVVLIHWAGSLAWIASRGAMVDSPMNRAVDAPRPRDLATWGAVRGRAVLVCGSSPELIAGLAGAIREAGARRVVAVGDGGSPVPVASGATAIAGDLGDPEFVRRMFAHLRPDLVILADGPRPARLDGSLAIATRRVANEALRAGVEAVVRIAPEWERADGRLACRVLDALAGLTSTSLVRVSYPAQAERHAIARATLRAASYGRPGRYRMNGADEGLRVDPTAAAPADAEALWAALDRV